MEVDHIARHDFIWIRWKSTKTTKRVPKHNLLFASNILFFFYFFWACTSSNDSCVLIPSWKSTNMRAHDKNERKFRMPYGNSMPTKRRKIRRNVLARHWRNAGSCDIVDVCRTRHTNIISLVLMRTLIQVGKCKSAIKWKVKNEKETTANVFIVCECYECEFCSSLFLLFLSSNFFFISFLRTQ